MRVAALLFLSLCFFVSAVSGHVNAEVIQHKKTAHIIRFTDPKSQSNITKCYSINGNCIYLINVEDEEEDFVCARKYVLLANNFTTPERSFISVDPFLNSNDKAIYCRHLALTSSCKYLTMRVLRI